MGLTLSFGEWDGLVSGGIGLPSPRAMASPPLLKLSSKDRREDGSSTVSLNWTIVVDDGDGEGVAGKLVEEDAAVVADMSIANGGVSSLSGSLKKPDVTVAGGDLDKDLFHLRLDGLGMFKKLDCVYADGLGTCIRVRSLKGWPLGHPMPTTGLTDRFMALLGELELSGSFSSLVMLLRRRLADLFPPTDGPAAWDDESYGLGPESKAALANRERPVEADNGGGCENTGHGVRHSEVR